MYIHELMEWPKFSWDDQELKPLIDAATVARQELFHQLGHSCFQDLDAELRSEAGLQMLTQEVLKTSEIEGERLDPEQVRSSIARKLGLDRGGLRTSSERTSRNIDGIVNMVLDASRNWKEPLTDERLCKWHAWIFPTGYNEFGKINVGQWRTDPIEVVSSPLHREHVHFAGPAAERLQREMENFLRWFEEDQKIEPLIKAGISHLYFVTIHPFNDGNGRIARAIADLALARADKVDQRFYSMSAQIKNDQKDYYIKLEDTQKGTLDITDWLQWFLQCLIRSVEWAVQALQDVIRKAKVLKQMENLELNERQEKVMLKFLDGGFGEILNSRKYKIATDCSPDTANRDLSKLAELGLLRKSGAGKGTSYSLNTE
jgi:Fic family protein